MPRIFPMSMAHDVTYVPVGKRNSVTTRHRLAVSVEIEEAPASDFQPLLTVHGPAEVFNRVGLEPIGRLKDAVVHVVRGRDVYAPIDERHFMGTMTASLVHDRDFSVPFIRTAAENVKAEFDPSVARAVEEDGRDQTIATAHEIASNLVLVDGKMFKRVNVPFFDLRQNYRALTDVYRGDRPLFGLDVPCTEIDRILSLFDLSPDLVTCSLNKPVELGQARRALRDMLATVKLDNEASGAGLAWRISRHDMSRRIDRISTPADAAGVARDFFARFSSGPHFSDGTIPKMLLRIIEFYGAYDAPEVDRGDVALTFDTRDDKVQLVEIEGHLYRRSDPMNAAHQAMDLDINDPRPVVVDRDGAFWAKVQPPMLGYNGGGQTYYFQTLPKPGMGIALPATFGPDIAQALSRHAGREIGFPQGLTIGAGVAGLSAAYRHDEMHIVSGYALRSMGESFAATPFLEAVDSLAEAVASLQRAHADGVTVEREILDLAERGCRAIEGMPAAVRAGSLGRNFELVRSVMAAVVDTTPSLTHELDEQAPTI